ncbi:8650_t:CDS:2, partial [Racocetra fulgida]
RLEAIWKKRDALKDATNTILVQDDSRGADEGPSKKRRIDVEIGETSLERQQELPHSITRSEVYKRANIQNIKSDEILSLPGEPLPERLQNYLAKKRKPNKNLKEEDIQNRALISSKVRTVLEIKRRKCMSSLTDEDKGQLLDYIYAMVQQQPL